MRNNSGFALIELKVIGVAGIILSGLLLATLQSAKLASNRAKCVSNLRQLTAGWLLYTEDNKGWLIGGGTGSDYMQFPPVPRTFDWTLDLAPGHTPNSVEAITNGCLWPYIRNLKVYHCPGDPSTHLRSYSINTWLRGESFSEDGNSLNTYNLYSDLRRPARTYVFIEENDTRGYNIGSFQITSPSRWIDFVPNFHENSDNLSFADGHVENWHWLSTNTTKYALAGQRAGSNTPYSRTDLGNPDLTNVAKAAACSGCPLP